jgi:hypothetical protein
VAIIDEYLRALGIGPSTGLPGTFGRGPGSTLPVMPDRGIRTGLPVMPDRGPGSTTMPLPDGGSNLMPIVRTDPIPSNPPRPDNSTSENPYFNPGSTGGKRNLYDTGWSESLGKLNPLSEWTRWTSMSGMGGNNRRGQFAANQFGKFDNAFNAHLLERPDSTLRGFAKMTDPMTALKNEWLGSSANARGLNNASRASTIRMG